MTTFRLFSKPVAFLLWFLGGFGILGLHRFYLRRWGTGLIWLGTLGLLGVGAIVDLFTLGATVDAANARAIAEAGRRAALARQRETVLSVFRIPPPLLGQGRPRDANL